MSETDSFTVIAQNGKVDVVIGYSSVGTNRITIPVNVNTYKDIQLVSFNTGKLANILQANKECKSVSMKVSEKGLIKLNFEVDDFESEYYLVATQQVR